MTHSTITLRELAHRAHDGLEVTLLWDPRSNEVSIDVVDERNASSASFPPRSPRAPRLMPSNHPYIYARRRGAKSRQSSGSGLSPQPTLPYFRTLAPPGPQEVRRIP